MLTRKRFIIGACFLFLSCRSTQDNKSVKPLEDPPKNASTKSGASTQKANESPAKPKIESKVTELQIQQSCELPAQLFNSLVKINYPKRQTCKFTSKPNMQPRAGLIEATESTQASADVPPNTEICSIQVESSVDTKFHYNDFLVLTLNEFVIYASNKELSNRLESFAGLLKWDASRVLGSEIKDLHSPAFCLSSSENCQMPGTGQTGPVLIKLKYNEIAGLSKAMLGKETVPMNLVSTGDRVELEGQPDCSHEALDLTLRLNYIYRSK